MQSSLTESEKIQLSDTINNVESFKQQFRLLSERWNTPKQSVTKEVFDTTKKEFSILLKNIITDFPFNSVIVSYVIGELITIKNSILPLLEYDTKNGWLVLYNMIILQVEPLLNYLQKWLDPDTVIKNTRFNVSQILGN